MIWKHLILLGACVRAATFVRQLPVLALALWGGVAVAAASPVTPTNLSVSGMFMGADWVVKSVMISLALASVATWAILIAKVMELRRGKKELGGDLGRLNGAPVLGSAPAMSSESASDLMAIARQEVGSAVDYANPVSAEAVKERLSIRLAGSEATSIQSMLSGMNILASIGATSPFVGLFGTVWGIMNAFIGISEAQTTNLAVVAPGIAEALLATALGLVAAIPAVLIYNGFSRAIGGYRRLLADFSTRVACLVSHEIERLQVAKSA